MFYNYLMVEVRTTDKVHLNNHFCEICIRPFFLHFFAFPVCLLRLADSSLNLPLQRVLSEPDFLAISELAAAVDDLKETHPSAPSANFLCNFLSLDLLQSFKVFVSGLLRLAASFS